MVGAAPFSPLVDFVSRATNPPGWAILRGDFIEFYGLPGQLRACGMPSLKNRPGRVRNRRR
jgi:hypothetical protein